MNNQEIINIKIEDLVLWTENPRDPISPDLIQKGKDMIPTIKGIVTQILLGKGIKIFS